MPVRSYQEDLLKRLSNRDYAAEYLKVSFEEATKDGNTKAFLLALKNVVQATQSMSIVKNKSEADNSQIQLLELLEVSHPVTIETLALVLSSVGLTLDFQPSN